MHFCIIFPLQSSSQTSAEIPKNLLSTEMQLPLGRSQNVASADLGVAREQAGKFGLVPFARAGWCGLCPGMPCGLRTRNLPRSTNQAGETEKGECKNAGSPCFLPFLFCLPF